MSDLLKTGASALLGYQQAIATTARNIANVDTQGYHRQHIELNPTTPPGAGLSGAPRLQRAEDSFVQQQLLRTHANLSSSDTVHVHLSGLEQQLSAESLSLTPALSRFFSAWQDAGNQPESMAAREAVIAAGQGLAERFRRLDQQLASAQQATTQAAQQSADEINSTVEQLAELNQAIARQGWSRADASFPRVNAGRYALQDQQERLLHQLASHVDISVTYDDAGRADVFLRDGAALLTGSRRAALQPGRLVNATSPAESTDTNHDRLWQLHYLDNQGNASGTQLGVQPSGGRLGANQQVNDQSLAPLRARLGEFAATLSQQLNDQHQIGTDRNGDAGAALFSLSTTDSEQAAGGLYFKLENPAQIALAVNDTGDAEEASEKGYDNQNALAMASLAEASLADTGQSPTAYWATWLASLGTMTREADDTLAAHQSLHQQQQQRHDSLTGVNLDEEAIALTRYQQSYQASARIITAADELFNTLLGALR